MKAFEKKWGFEFDYKIKTWTRDWAEYQGYYNGLGEIKLNLDQTRFELLEDFYHEIGHMILDQYAVPRHMLDIFRDYNPNISRERSEKLTLEGEEAPPQGYVSWYSLVNGTEEFCELLSAWVCSGYKMTGTLNYGGWKHSIENEPKLKRKIIAIKKILELEN